MSHTVRPEATFPLLELHVTPHVFSVPAPDFSYQAHSPRPVLICEAAVPFPSRVCSQEPVRVLSERLVMPSAFYKRALKIIKTFMDPNGRQKLHSNK